MNQNQPSKQQANILIVDDAIPNLRLLSTILTEKGYKVRSATKGETALKIARSYPTDLILLDIMMPEMDGYEVCQQLKADERTQDIPIIFISVFKEVPEREKAFGMGAVDYITKPFQIEEVWLRVENQLRQQRLQKQLTEQKEALRLVSDRLQHLLSSSPVAIYSCKVGENFGMTFTSENVAAIVGYEAGEFLADSGLWSRQIHPEDKQRVLLGLARVLLKGFHACEYRFRHKDGTYRWIYDRLKLIKDEAENPIECVGYWADITDRKQAEMALRESQRRYQVLAEAAPVCIFHADAESNWLYVNQCWKEMTGLSDRKALGMGWTRVLHPEDSGRILTQWRLATRGKKPFKSEFRLVRANGTTAWVIGQALAEIGDEGEIIGYVGTITDISERKQAEIALQQQFKREQLVVSILERIRASLNLEEVLSLAVREVREFLATDRAIIYRFNPDWNGIVAVESVGSGWKSTLAVDIQDKCFIENFVPLYQQGRVRAIENIYTAGLEECHVNLLERFEVKANLVVPLLQGEKLWGLLIVHHCRSSRLWYPSEVDCLRQLSVQLAIAIQQCTLYEQAQTEIGDRQQAEAKLLQSERRFRDVSEAVGEYLWEVDVNGVYTFATERAKFVKGYTSAELIGHKPIEFMLPADIEKVRKISRLAFKSKSTFKLEHRNITPTGEIIWEEVVGIPLLDCHGNVIGYRGAGLNITERKIAEAKLQQAKEAADAANHAKSEFLAQMSHELRTPLNAILGFTQIMNRDASLNPEQQEYLSIISRSGEHLLSLINDILEMSKIEAGMVALNENNFDLIRLLHSLEEMLRLKALNKGLYLQIKYASDIPQYVRTDENKLRQVLINLLGNAIKFTQKGSVTLQVGYGRAEALNAEYPMSCDRLFFEVTDTGSGIAPEEIDKLFQAFGQTETGRKSQQGTGLGLAISRKFVQLMGGDISVDSSVNGGTKFTFDIQVGLAALDEIEHLPEKGKIVGLEPDRPESRILVVEDVKVSRILLVKLLTSIGFEVREATNGEEAIALWESWNPHLIFMDMQMPVMDGYEATQQIKARERERWENRESDSIEHQSTMNKTAIVALTTSAFEEQRNAILSTGCDDFIRKPFQEEVIFEKIAQHLGVRYLYEPLPGEELSSSYPIPGNFLGNRVGNETYTLDASSFKEMPVEWVAALHQAAIEADGELILSLIGEISTSNPTLSTVLADLVVRFQYEKISDCTGEAIGE